MIEKLYACYISIMKVNNEDKLEEVKKIQFITINEALDYYEKNETVHLARKEYLSIRFDK